MKNMIVVTAIMANLLLLSSFAMADSPATSYYTTSGYDPVTRNENVSINNPPCPEELRIYGDFSKTGADEPCDVPKRLDRIWICNDGTGSQGLDVKYLPADPCR